MSSITRFRFLLADSTGIFAVKDNGELFRSTTPVLSSAGRIDDGDWADFIHVFAGGDGILYAVTADGKLRWYQYHDGSDGSPVGFDSASGNVIDEGGWSNFIHLFSDSEGAIYAVEPSGALRYYRDNARNGSSDWGENSGSVIHEGFNEFTNVISGGDGVIYAARSDGDLFFYRDVARNGAPDWGAASGTRIGTGWNQFTHIFSGEPGVIYVIRCENVGGSMFVYQDLRRDGSNEITGGWNVDNSGAQGWQCIPIEGYAWPLSAAPGEKLRFYLSAVLPGDCDVSFARLRRHPFGHRLEALKDCARIVAVDYQRASETAWSDGCEWEPALSFFIPASWSPGFYVARCSAKTGYVFDVPFVVRADVDAGDIAVIANVDTWNAYNSWGGESNYSIVPFKQLSFLRPNHHLLTAETDHPKGNHMLRGEVWLFDWLTDLGYQPHLYTDIDIDEDRISFSSYKCIVLSTHPEYWSVKMIDKLINYLDNGGKILYLGGNVMYRPMTFEADHTAIRSHSIADESAFWTTISNRSVVGVTVGLPVEGGGGGYVIRKPGHRFFGGAVAAGEEIGSSGGWNVGPERSDGGAYGWEVEWIDAAEARPGVVGLAQDPNDPTRKTMAYYEEPINGGWVLGAGSITFGGTLMVDPILQLMIKNALDECLS